MSDKNHALIAIAAAATALAAAATALVSGEKTTCGKADPAPTPDAEPAQEEVTTPTKRRGRPPGTAAPVVDVKPEPEAAAEPEPTGMKLEELQALIKPLIEEGKGAEVKKVISKYAPKLSEIAAKDHKAFSKDIEALSM